MQFRRLTFERFRAFDQGVVFELNRPPGLYFLTARNEAQPHLGANGCGKSTIWSALYWSLYGATPENIRSPDLYSWHAADRGYVSVTETDQHIIARSWSPNELSLDNRIVDQDTINNVLGLTAELFKCAVLLSQGGETFLDRTPTEKMALLSGALRLDRWKEYSAHAKLKAANNRSVEGSTNTEIAKLEALLENDESNPLHTRARLYEEQRKAGLQKLNKEIENEEALVKEWFEHCAVTRAVLDETRAEGEALKERLKQQTEKWERLVEAQNKAGAAADVLTKQVKELSASIEGFTSLVGQTCTRCKQPVDEVHARRELRRMREEYAQLAKKESAAASKAMELFNRRARATDVMFDLKEQVEKAGDRLQTVYGKYEDSCAQETLSKIKLKALQDTLAKAKGEENPYLEDLRALEERQDARVRRIRHLKRSRKLVRRMADRHEYWVDAFKEIRLQLLQDVLGHLNAHLGNACEYLGLRGWNVHYELEHETKGGDVVSGFNTWVQSPTSQAQIPFKAWSGGEQQRLRLAAAIGLVDFLNERLHLNCNLEVYDEPTQHLSKEGIDDLLHTLKQRALSLGKCVWLVDHNTIKFAGFNDVVTVVMTPKGAHLE